MGSRNTATRPQTRRNVNLPRGIRNNNPLNIRIGNVWLGEVTKPTDPDFEQFCTIEYGLRAAFVILRRYIRRYGHDTVRKIISRWAPSNENATENYITLVSASMNLSPDEPLKYEDKETMCKLVSAMCLVENGQKVDEAKITKAYDMT